MPDTSTQSPIAAILSRSPFFRDSVDLNAEEREILAKKGLIRIYGPNLPVFSANEAGPCFYVVSQGDFELRLANGRTKILTVGDVFGQVAAFSEVVRLGSVVSKGNGTLVAFNAKLFAPDSGLPPEISQKVLLALLRMTSQYLTEFISYIPTKTEELLRKGEGETIEFKEVVFPRNLDKVINTIAAFINSKGGSLLIGVKDDGEVMGAIFKGEGIKEQFDDEDQFFNTLNNKLSLRMGAKNTLLIHYNWQVIQGKRILRIDCLPSEKAAFVTRDGRELFYYRKGPTTRRIDNIPEIIDYVEQRRLDRESSLRQMR